MRIQQLTPGHVSITLASVDLDLIRDAVSRHARHTANRHARLVARDLDHAILEADAQPQNDAIAMGLFDQHATCDVRPAQLAIVADDVAHLAAE